MSLLHLAARENDFVYYYVGKPMYSLQNPPVLLFSDIFLPTETAYKMVNKKRAKNGESPFEGSLVVVCIDRLSGRLYLPEGHNVKSLLEDDAFKACLQSAIMDFEKRYDASVSMARPVSGDPSTTFRIKQMSDYPSVMNFITRNLKADHSLPQGVNIPVIEARLSIMPETVNKSFPEFQNKDTAPAGKYVQGGDVVDFRTGEGESAHDIYSIAPPFILIDLDSKLMQKQSSRESMVVFLMKEHIDKSNVGYAIHNPQLYSFRYYLYSGWSIKELCEWIFTNSNFDSLSSLMNTGAMIIVAARDLAKHYGTFDININNYYYYVFRTDLSKFPFQFMPSPDLFLSENNGMKNFLEVKFFNPATNTIVLKSPLYFTDKIIEKYFASQGRICTCNYNPNYQAIMSTMSPNILNEKEKKALVAVNNGIQQDGVAAPSGKKFIPFKTMSEIDAYYEMKKISDFPEAYDALYSLCSYISKKNNTPVGFTDLPVVVGPFSQTGMAGGFISAVRNADKKKKDGTPVVVDGKIEIIHGLSVPVPCILIDTLDHPTPVERQYVLRHEYRHFINEQLKIESPIYNLQGQKTPDELLKELKTYYTSPDEHDAFVEEVKYLIGIGLDKNQIFKHIFNEPVTIHNIHIAKIIRNIINDAVNELEQDMKERKEELMKSFYDPGAQASETEVKVPEPDFTTSPFGDAGGDIF